LNFCKVETSTVAISIGAGAALVLLGCSINSQSGTAAITGAGTVRYANLSFYNITTTINTTTQTPLLAMASLPYTNVTTASYTTLDQDQYFSVDPTASAITIKLPNAPTYYRPYYIKDRTGKAGTNNITITTVAGAVLFDGATSYLINTNYGSIQVIFNGTSYEVS
jgi:hypothetical protein